MLLPLRSQRMVYFMDFHGTSQSKMDDDWSPMTS